MSAQIKPWLWQKGVSGNPKGRPSIPPEFQGMRILTPMEVTCMITKYARMTYEQLCESDPKASSLELAIRSVLMTSIEKGDFTRLEFLLSRSIGKVKEYEPTQEDDEERAKLRDIPLKDLLVLIQNNISEQEEGK